MRAAERRLVVAVEHRHRRLRDDRPGVGARVDEVHGAAGDARAVVERLPLRVHAGERRQERRVDVEDAAGKGAEEASASTRRMKPASTTSSTPCRAQRRHERGVEGLRATA